MDQLTRRIEHIKNILTSSELRTLCFDLGLDAAALANDDISIFASNIVNHLQETNQLEHLIHIRELDESIAEQISDEAGHLIRLHAMMMETCGSETMRQVCKNSPLRGWETFQELAKRDFYREIIILANRKGHLPALIDSMKKACHEFRLEPLQSPNRTQKPGLPWQRMEILNWIQNQASQQDLAHLAFLVGVDFEEYFWPSNDHNQKGQHFADYFEKRNRLHEVQRGLKQIVDS